MEEGKEKQTNLSADERNLKNKNAPSENRTPNLSRGGSSPFPRSPKIYLKRAVEERSVFFLSNACRNLDKSQKGEGGRFYISLVIRLIPFAPRPGQERALLEGRIKLCFFFNRTVEKIKFTSFFNDIQYI